jgi:TRAP-type C4-dicarboxylate transport system permease small subunit
VTLLIWIAQPLAVGALFIAVAYWVSIALSKMQKVLVLVLVFILSILLFLLLVGGMSWFSESLSIDISAFGAPVNALNDINNMSRVLTGV